MCCSLAARVIGSDAGLSKRHGMDRIRWKMQLKLRVSWYILGWFGLLRQGLGCGSSVASLPLGVEFAICCVARCKLRIDSVGAEVQLMKINCS